MAVMSEAVRFLFAESSCQIMQKTNIGGALHVTGQKVPRKWKNETM